MVVFPRHIALGLFLFCIVSPVYGDEGVCTVCHENMYCSNEAVHTCPENSRSSAGSDAIEDCSCRGGYSGVDGGECTECPAHNFCTGGNSIVSCPDNSESPVGSNSSSACTCKMGWYGPQGGECTECEAGTYCRMGIKEQCPANKYSPKGSDEVDDCLCVAGYYGPPGSSRGDCVECPRGMWCPGGGNDEYEGRYQCVQNSMSPYGSTNYTDCVCDPRYHGPDGGNCQSCTADEYCPGGTDSLDCPVDSGSPQLSSDVTECICDGGYTGDAGGPCTLCTEDTYCSGGTMDSCPVHSRSSSGSDELSDCSCKPGWVGENGGVCTMCTENSFCTGGNSTVNCPANSKTLVGSNSTLD
jgi:hypothetical protein